MSDEYVKSLLNTKSIAGLYEEQGYFMDALSVYYYLLEKEPSNDSYKSKIDELETNVITEKEKRVVNLLHEWFEVLIPEKRSQVLEKIKMNIK
ncbi:MAG: hypothetical protein GY714_32640 [Desulfobacterales bacterium]|nr:hypothetical protein [Desulfobacterales bacterium]MCP4160081.1 hypothetical protein [Deltaproteobacteria bacterium]